jgi:bacillithiol biosynthesis cysteine-adding enzyme BshC
MEAACIRQTQLPHTSRLFEHFSYQFDKVARFYRHDPHDPVSFDHAAAELDYPEERRAALIRALRPANPDSRSLERLAKPGAVAIVTGQQVGLFSGPAYTIYKALTAARIAQRLTEQGLEAVPVFWLATEDHDFEEVNHAWLFGPDSQPRILRATAQVDNHRPVGTLELTGVPLDEMRAALDAFPHGAEVAEQVAACYTAGATMGAAFRELLRRLLAPFDLVYVDPLEPEFREIGAPLLRVAVERAADLKQLVIERNRELAEAGYHAQVHIEPDTSLVFLLEGGHRITLKMRNGDRYDSPGKRYSKETLMERADALSPNALLRPVLQDYVLPTVSYVGGPAELAYLAQAQPIYGALLGRMPVATHRASFTLLDARAHKLMDRYGLSWPTIYEGEDGIRRHISKRLVPERVETTFESTRRVVENALERLALELQDFDPTLERALAKSRAKIVYQLSKMEAKTAREALRRDDRASEEARFLAGLLYPNKHLQERLYTILPFLAKHGFDLLDRIHENIRLDCPDHSVLIV